MKKPSLSICAHTHETPQNIDYVRMLGLSQDDVLDWTDSNWTALHWAGLNHSMSWPRLPDITDVSHRLNGALPSTEVLKYALYCVCINRELGTGYSNVIFLQERWRISGWGVCVFSQDRSNSKTVCSLSIFFPILFPHLFLYLLETLMYRQIWYWPWYLNK